MVASRQNRAVACHKVRLSAVPAHHSIVNGAMISSASPANNATIVSRHGESVPPLPIGCAPASGRGHMWVARLVKELNLVSRSGVSILKEDRRGRCEVRRS